MLKKNWCAKSGVFYEKKVLNMAYLHFQLYKIQEKRNHFCSKKDEFDWEKSRTETVENSLRFFHTEIKKYRTTQEA